MAAAGDHQGVELSEEGALLSTAGNFLGILSRGDFAFVAAMNYEL